MAALIVRKLDEDLVRRLKARAQAHGRSAEAEHRAILEEVLRPEPTISGAEFWRALRHDGPLLEEDGQFFQALEELEQPAEAPDFAS